MSIGPAGEGCDLCGADGGGGAACCCHHCDVGGSFSFFPPSAHRAFHRHDEAPKPPVREFQFFGNEGFDDCHESVTWLFDDPTPPLEDCSSLPTAGRQQQPFKYDVVPSLFGRNGGGLTFEVSLGRPAVDVDAELELGGVGGGGRRTEAVASATIIHCGSTFTDAVSSTPKEAAMAHGGESLNQINLVAGAVVGREAKVMRYKEKRKKRCYEKKVRYTARKAYAEMRPRVRGRFAKVPEAVAPPLLPPSTYDPSRLELG